MLQDLANRSAKSSLDHIDALPTLDMLRVINAADHEVALAVERELPHIARAVDDIVARLRIGGHLFYTGAGTSGRLGVLDASECPPTFNTPPDLVQGIIAGGDRALRHPSKRPRTIPIKASKISSLTFCCGDVFVGIAASGRTPYVLGAIAYARSLGRCHHRPKLHPEFGTGARSEIAITPAPGPEIVTGSTRIRAGTATKLVLNMLTTGAMIRLGYVYGNLMVNVQPTNEKLVDRARRIIASIAGVSYDEASRLLNAAGSVRTAIVMHKTNLTRAKRRPSFLPPMVV